MNVTIVSGFMCSACQDAKEIFEAHDIGVTILDATTNEGMTELAMCFDGPGTLLPAIICDTYADMEVICDLINQIGEWATVGVKKL